MARSKDSAPLQQRQKPRPPPRARSSSSSSSSSDSDDVRSRPPVPFIRRVPAASTTSKSPHSSQKSGQSQQVPRRGVAKPQHHLHLAAIVAQRAPSSTSSSREVQRASKAVSKSSAVVRKQSRPALQSSSSSGSTSTSSSPSPPRARSKTSQSSLSSSAAASAAAAQPSSNTSPMSRMLDEDLVKFFSAVDEALATSVGRLRGSDKLRVSSFRVWCFGVN